MQIESVYNGLLLIIQIHFDGRTGGKWGFSSNSFISLDSK